MYKYPPKLVHKTARYILEKCVIKALQNQEYYGQDEAFFKFSEIICSTFKNFEYQYISDRDEMAGWEICQVGIRKDLDDKFELIIALGKMGEGVHNFFGLVLDAPTAGMWYSTLPHEKWSTYKPLRRLI